MALLKRAYRSGKLEFHGKLAPLVHPAVFERRLNASVKKDWVVYVKRPFGGPQRVLKYLARYTHRVAISNQRLVALRDGRVTFQYKDYADRQRSKLMTLASNEFIRRFLLHTLPSGFVRVRYYGLLANRDRRQRLDHCRRLLGAATSPMQPPEEAELPTEDSPCPSPTTCPVRGRGSLVIIHTVPAVVPFPPPRPYFLIRRAAGAVGFDSS
jgi:hypothetical protein